MPQPPAGAVTVHTYGPFDVSFYNNSETYTDYWGQSYTGTKNWTTTEMDDVAAMIQIWDDGIANAAGPRQIKLNLMWNALGGSLGISSNTYSGDETTALTYVEKLWRTHTNFSNSYADAFIRMDTSTTWNIGSGAPSFNSWDFRSVVAHEIGHSLGFTSTYNLAGADIWWSGGLTEWDKHLRDAATGGNQPNVGGSGTPGNFNQTANPVYFDGANANAANGGSRVAIYAPTNYEPGSSLTHLNESTFPNALMSTSIANGQIIRQPTPLEWEMMKDIGWTINTVTKTWSNGAGTLEWGTADNWSSSGMPSSTQATYFTNAGLSSGNTVNLGSSRSVGSLFFDTTTNFTIGGASGTLTLATGSLSRTASSSGTQTIARPIALGANAVWYIDGSGEFQVTNWISGGYSLEKGGVGILNLSGANTYNGATRVKNGTLTISGGSTGSTAFDVASGTIISFTGGTHSLGGATFSNAGTIYFNGGTENFATATTLPGTVNINGGTVNFNNPTSSNLTGAVTFSNGTIGGTGPVSFQNLSWTYGNIANSGGVNIPVGGVLSIVGNTQGFNLNGGSPKLNNSGITTVSGSALYSFNGTNTTINNQASGVFNLQGNVNFTKSGTGTGTINNSGIFKKSAGSGTATISWALSNTGTVQAQSGTLSFTGAVTQISGNTLTGGSWIVKPNSTLNITAGSSLTINQGNVTLDGAGSTFSKINGLINNQGSFSILNGRNFTTAANLANSGTLTVGSGSNFSISGDLTGTGNTNVNGLLSADSIVQNTLAVGSGGKVTIGSTGGMPLLNEGTAQAVPEPGTLCMLLIALTMSLGMRKSSRRIG
ncbi:MAG TPA: autotransporter-associated beta strand repeat-containing protein [Thermoguttaceae bacterium]